MMWLGTIGSLAMFTAIGNALVAGKPNAFFLVTFHLGMRFRGRSLQRKLTACPMTASGRFCCKSRFALLVRNSVGR
jgi:hypothetical protein